MKSWFAALALLLAAPALAAAQPRDISAPGTVPHAAAHAGFPERVGEFERSQVLRFDDRDIAANYNLERGSDFVRLSVYIYPAPRASGRERASTCQELMRGVSDAIFQQYPGAIVDESGAAPAVPDVEADLGLRSVHSIRVNLRGTQPEDARSESRLYCFVGGDWLVKYRVSTNAGSDIDLGALIDDFIRRGPWPGRGPASIALR